ncbi:MAG: hypothetical protein HY606_04075 [Planctomycetes bacterium]|nr:hypothetical protein [Planctomycetota bacterium]
MRSLRETRKIISTLLPERANRPAAERVARNPVRVPEKKGAGKERVKITARQG